MGSSYQMHTSFSSYPYVMKSYSSFMNPWEVVMFVFIECLLTPFGIILQRPSFHEAPLCLHN